MKVHNKTNIIPVGLASVTVLTGAFLLANKTHADDVVDDVNITVPVSCTMSGTDMDSHTAEIANGTSNSAIGETTINALCNDADGFAIYTIGFTDNTEGKNVLTNATLGSTYDIATGTGTSGNSQWAMKVTTQTDPEPDYPVTIQNSFDSFHTVPDDYTMVAKREAGTDIGTGATGSTITTTYQAYISNNQPAGTYLGKVKYVLVHPNDAGAPVSPINCPAGYICYAPNANDVVGSMNVEVVGTYSGDTSSAIGYQPMSSNTATRLIAPNYKRSGYGFAGWNLEYDGTGTTYGPNADYTTGDLSNAGVAMYAKWIPSSGSLQEWNGCATLGNEEVIALTDNRDNNTYAVAKYIDGNCWTIENLRLDANMVGGINVSNTNNPAGTFTSLVASTDEWCSTVSSDCFERVVLNNNNINFGGVNASGVDLIASPGGASGTTGYSGENYQWYSYGNYYNWYTATAGNGGYTYPEGYNVQTDGDICPSGWTLPTAQSNGQFDNLNRLVNTDTYTSLGLRKYPYNFVFSGQKHPQTDSRGDAGYYWSKTKDSGSTGRLLYISNTYTDSHLYNNKAYGYAIRCLKASS